MASSEALRCRDCGHEFRAGSRFCSGCGCRLASACPECGAPAEAGDRFCSQCGARFEAAGIDTASRGRGTPLPRASSALSASSAPPEAFADGRYRIQRFLGEGAKKRVYLARDTLLDRDVALALLKTDGLDDAGRVRVRREAQAMGRLGDHPHVVTVHDIGEEGDQIFIVCQFMAGGDVERRIRDATEKRLDLEDALRIAREVGAALVHAHGQGIVHRDLKPGNVWLSDDGGARLGDFGLAIVMDRSRITQEGTMVGTASYMAPEQALSGNVTPSSDLYALGAMLYEMLTGRPPFVGNDSVSVISQHINSRPVAPSWHNAKISPELEVLILSLLEKDPGARPPSAAVVVERLDEIAAAPPPAPAQAATPGTGRLALGRFVGRATELEQLKKAVDRALGGHGSVMMLVGEPGIGKTRLYEETGVYARLRGAQVLVGKCHETEAGLPYLPFVQALGQYVAQRPDDALREELGDAASDVAKLISEIRQRIPDLPQSPAVEPDQERYRLFESVVSFLLNASHANPLVLVLDDLHWADRPTLLLLQHLARRLAGTRLFLIGTYRDIELDRRHPLSSVLADLRRERLFERILLKGLSVDEVTGLLAAMAEHEMDERGQALAQIVHQETEGNPFFIEEIVRHLVESGAIYQKDGRWVSDATSMEEIGIPEGVREVIGRRLSRLSEECNRALSNAAILGREFDFTVLGRMAGLQEDALVAAIEEALEAQMIVEADRRGGSGTYAFTHALVRQTLDDELSLPRKQRFHLKAGEAIEAVHGRNLGPELPALAKHYRMAGAASDLERTLEYSIRAGDMAASVFAWEEAGEHWEGALELMEDEGVEPKRRARLLVRLGDLTYVSAQDQSKCVARFEEALRLYQKLGDDRRAAQVHSRLGRTLSTFAQLMDINRASEHLRAAEEILSREGDSVPLCAALVGIATAAMQAVRIEEGLDASRRAMEIAERLGNEASWANAAGLHGCHLVMAGRLREGEEILGRSWELADRLNLAIVAYFTTAFYTTLYFETRDQHANFAVVDRELAKPRISQAPVQLASMLSARCSALAIMGSVAEAKEIYDEIGSLQGNEALIRTAEGEWAEVERICSEDVARNEVHGGNWLVGFARFRRGRARRMRGDFDGAAEDLRWLVASRVAQGMPVAEANCRCELGLLELERGRVAEARAEIERCREILAGGEDYRGLVGGVDAVDAIVTVFEGRRSEAESLLAQAQSNFEHYPQPWEEADCLFLFGRALAESGDRRAASGKLDQALAIYRRIGAGTAWLERVLAEKMRTQGSASSDVKGSIYAVAESIDARRPDIASHAAPDGTVTLMFSDMEGFTAMTERLGDLRAREVIRDHNRIVREQVAAQRGYELELQGDGFLLAFGSARDGVRCAIEIQKCFASYCDAHPDEPIRVRIGLHTGEVLKDADKFFGRTVILAARIAAQARGEEILASSLVRELVVSAGDLRFGAPREMRLKGLSGTQRVFSVVWR